MNNELLPAAAGYDRALTVFSPDGRLYQVEYAIETVRRGTLALGMRFKDGILLAVEERPRKLQNPETTQKIFQIDDHVGVVAAGYIPDARSQVDNARFFSQSNRMIYDESVEVESVAKHLADQCQQFTQYAGVRPFGVALILAGTNKNGDSLFLTDPSGTYISYHAVAIGAGSDQVTEFLEKYYENDMSLEDAAALAAEAIFLVSEEKEETKHIKMAKILRENKLFTKISDDEIENYTKKAKENSSSRSSSASS